jgi:hypothetical protein
MTFDPARSLVHSALLLGGLSSAINLATERLVAGQGGLDDFDRFVPKALRSEENEADVQTLLEARLVFILTLRTRLELALDFLAQVLIRDENVIRRCNRGEIEDALAEFEAASAEELAEALETRASGREISPLNVIRMLGDLIHVVIHSENRTLGGLLSLCDSAEGARRIALQAETLSQRDVDVAAETILSVLGKNTAHERIAFALAEEELVSAEFDGKIPGNAIRAVDERLVAEIARIKLEARVARAIALHEAAAKAAYRIGGLRIAAIKGASPGFKEAADAAAELRTLVRKDAIELLLGEIDLLKPVFEAIKEIDGEATFIQNKNEIGADLAIDAAFSSLRGTLFSKRVLPQFEDAQSRIRDEKELLSIVAALDDRLGLSAHEKMAGASSFPGRGAGIPRIAIRKERKT